ncbi:MAG: hypothetical protein J6D22_02030, partial [Pyramidobacter sp.]|nr:hypothetical protein [Pyramidobacter sp.]
QEYAYVLSGDNIQTPQITSKGFGAWELGLEREYDTYLYDRLASLDVMIAATADQTQSTAYLSYVAERAQIISTLQYYGLPTARPAEGSRSVALMVPYLALSPIIVSGGNITIEADSLTGANKGTLNANGSPKITINNESNLSVVLNGLWVLAPGGEVFVNSVSVKDAEDLRTRVAAAGGYNGEVHAEAGDGASPDITVNNSYSNTHVDFRMTGKNGESADVSYTVITDIENHGDVINYPGRVSLSTSVGSIRSVGAQIVGGKGISLHAPRGSISINSQGMLNIDGAPDDVWGAKLKDNVQALEFGTVSNGVSVMRGLPVYELLNNAAFADTPGNIVSGGNIFITAGVINVNGTIQSGFGAYRLNIGNALAQKISDYDSAWANNGSTALTDTPSLLAGYQLTSYDIVYDPERDEFVSAPASWYNPSTQRIVVDDITNAGGTIYLTGKVINTNFWDGYTEEYYNQLVRNASNDGYTLPSFETLEKHRGRIIAYTGAAEVIIESELETTLRLGRIDSKSNAA